MYNNVEYSDFSLGSDCGFWVTNKVCDARLEAGLNPDGSDPRDAESELLLAQAVLQAQNNPSTDNSWTATQTAGVIVASLVGITLLAVVIIKVRKKRRGK